LEVDVKTNKYAILSVVLILLVTSCSSGKNSAAQPAEPEMITLKMNSSALTSYAPIFIAEAEGYFKDAGIKIEYVTFNRSTEAIPLIVNGDLDVYAGALSSGLLNVLGQEDSIKVVADRGHVSPDDTCTYHGILFRKDLYDSGAMTGPADLAGRTIASVTTGPSGYLLSLYLAQAGLTFDDVNISDVPTASFADAMSNGTIDVVATTELTLSRVLSSGNAVLAVRGADVYGSYQTSVLVFGKNLLVENREAGIRFLTAYLRGVRQYNEGKTDRNVEIMAQYTSESPEILRNACWVTINNDGSIDFKASVAGFQQWSIAQGQLDHAIMEEQFWDPSILKEALAQLDQTTNPSK